jgi:signal transduction histidine kinase
MRALLRPTLVRRVCLALLMAFGLVYALLLGVQFAEELRKDEDPGGLFMLAGQVAAQLTAETEPARAALVGGATHRVVTAMLVPAPRGPLLLQIWHAGTGARAYSSDEAQSVELRAPRGRLAEQQVGGQRYRVANVEAGPWSVRVALRPLDRGWALRQLHSDLWPYVLMALPVVMLPLWLAVSRGLRPLTQLSRRIAARHPDDLSPLGLRPRYGELRPLVEAIEHLLQQLGRKVAGEQAFVQDAAHELRTPMAVINTQAHVVRRAADAAEKQEAGQALEVAVARASHLVGQLLELARVERHDAAPAAAVDVAGLARALLAQAAPAALRRGIELSLDSPDTLAATLDAQALHSVLGNLLDNAIRYGDDQGRVEVRLQPRGAGFVISVADDGPGIAPDERERVFDRFYRGSRRDAATGSGLGLAIVRRAAGRLGGAVTLAPGLDGRGCCFTLVVPDGRHAA